MIIISTHASPGGPKTTRLFRFSIYLKKFKIYYLLLYILKKKKLIIYWI